MGGDTAIKIDGLCKHYGLPVLQKYRQILSARPFPNASASWALREINLEVKKGEVLGIIGRNGAGKSTLLKVLAGVISPTRGSVAVKGRVFPMIELNAGIHPELSGRENAKFLSAIMGFSRRFIKENMAQVEEFCDIGEYFDKPVRTYSDGMLARLGFAVAVNIKADILLIDEVISVGDFNFQNKCLHKIKQMKEEEGVTVVFVSHNLDMLQYLCGRSAMLDNGALTKEGPSDEVITYYENSLHRLESKSNLSTGSYLSGVVELESVNIIDNDGNQLSVVDRNKGFLVNFKGRVLGSIAQPIFTFAIQNMKKEHCIFEIFKCNISPKLLSGYFLLTIKVPPLPLSGGCYTINFSVRDGDGYLTHVRYCHLASFLIEAAGRERGMLEVPLIWELKTGSGEFSGSA